MKKILAIVASLMLCLGIHAQLAWDTEFTKNDFNNAQTVISRSDNVTWPLTGGLQVGTVSILSDWSDECVIALPQTGIAKELHFAWHGASGGTVSVYQSADHNNWSQIFTADGNAAVTASDEVVPLATTTRYLKFAATGRLVVATFRRISVVELKELSASTDEWPFGSGMVDDADATKNVTVTWTNIVAEVSSTDPHFTASLNAIGQKNLIDQTTALTIRYSHAEAGQHSGEIVIAGEGKELAVYAHARQKLRRRVAARERERVRLAVVQDRVALLRACHDESRLRIVDGQHAKGGIDFARANVYRRAATAHAALASGVVLARDERLPPLLCASPAVCRHGVVGVVAGVDGKRTGKRPVGPGLVAYF